MNQVARSQKPREWTSRLSRFKNSGLSVAEFCREERVSVATFYYWKRRLHGRSSCSEPPKATVSPTQPSSTAKLAGKSGSIPADEPAFRPVQVSFAPKPALLVVRLPGNVELRVEDEPQLAENAPTKPRRLPWHRTRLDDACLGTPLSQPGIGKYGKSTSFIPHCF